jgi:hypothetical protein
MVNSASSPVAWASGRISKVGWIILKRVKPGDALSALPLRLANIPLREASSLP